MKSKINTQRWNDVKSNQTDFYNTYPKTKRNKYVKKNSNMNCTQPITIKNSQQIILLDFDDTLLPTTKLYSSIKLNNNISNGHIIPNDAFNQHSSTINVTQLKIELKKVGDALYDLIQTLLLNCAPKYIKIVTNSIDGWIYESLRLSGQIYSKYNDIYSLLTTNKIEMISAQSLGIKMNIYLASYWKPRCFYSILLKNIFKNNLKIQKYHVISIGDQWSDHQSVKAALEYLTANNDYQQILHHIIKVKECPTYNYLESELKEITNLIQKKVFIGHKDEFEGILIEFDENADDLKSDNNDQSSFYAKTQFVQPKPVNSMAKSEKKCLNISK